MEYSLPLVRITNTPQPDEISERSKISEKAESRTRPQSSYSRTVVRQRLTRTASTARITMKIKQAESEIETVKPIVADVVVC